MANFDELWDSLPSNNDATPSFDMLWDSLPESRQPTLREAAEQEAGPLEWAASGYLKGIAGLGDMLDLASAASSTNIGSNIGKWLAGVKPEAMPTKVGPGIREALDEFTGLEGSTEIGRESLPHIAASYLPATLLAPGTFGQKVASDIFSGTGGYIGRALGGDTGELVGAIGAPLAVSGGLGAAKKAAPFLRDIARKTELSAFGANKNAINKALKRMPEVLDDAGEFQNPISKAIASFRAEGGGTRGMEGAQLLDDLGAQLKDKGDELKGLLGAAQANQVDPIIPVFRFTDDYVAGLSGADKGRAIEMADDLKRATLDNTDGTILGLQGEKEKLSRSITETAWGDDVESKLRQNILKRIRADLRRSIEDGFESLTGQSKTIISDLNKQIGERQGLIPLFKDIIASGEARNPIAFIMQNMRTSGGLGQLGVAGAALGGYFAPAALVPMGVGAYATTPSGRRVGSDLLRALAGTSERAAYPSQVGGALPATELSREKLSELSSYLAQKLGIADSESSASDQLLKEGAFPEPESKGSEQKEDRRGQFRKKAISQSKAPEQTGRPSVLPFRDSLNKAIDNAMKTTFARNPTQAEPEKDSDFKRLTEAVIKQESAGNPKAVSRVGAKGLMQIMPATAKEIANELGLKDYDLEDPETNRMMGEHYLNKMLSQFKGDTELALAAYNAGPGRVRQWIKRYGPKWAMIAEAIRKKDPKHETLDYVSKIKKALASIEV